MRNLKIDWSVIRKIVITGIVLCIMFAVLVMLMNTVIMPMVVRHGREAITPDVTDIHLDAAKKILNEHGFKWGIIGEEYSPSKPRFTVLSQQPAPGLVVKSGRAIGLIISKGGETGMVPELRGLTLRQAKLMLEEDGFEPGTVTYDFETRLPPEVIVRTYPASGAQIERGGTVDLVVNLREGAVLVMVPDFIGMDFSSVENEIYEIGLSLGEVEYAENDSVLPETVLSQSLVAGMEVVEGTQISFTVSKPEEQ
jgi:beta-lactam-binding protein with PASTA domain